jgi:hypothetical protein
MKKILALAVAAVALSGSAFAQTGTVTQGNNSVTSGTITIKGTVVVPIEATVIDGDINFANIMRGASTIVSPQTSNIDAQPNPNAGKVGIVGDVGDPITVTVPASIVLTTTAYGGNDNTMDWLTVDDVNPAISYTSYLPTWVPQGSSVSPGTGAQTLGDDNSDVNGGLTYNTFPTTSSDALGAGYVWVGGKVTASATQQRGLYTGTITVTAAYTN